MSELLGWAMLLSTFVGAVLLARWMAPFGGLIVTAWALWSLLSHLI